MLYTTKHFSTSTTRYGYITEEKLDKLDIRPRGAIVSASASSAEGTGLESHCKNFSFVFLSCFSSLQLEQSQAME